MKKREEMKKEIISFSLATLIFLSIQVATLDFHFSTGMSYVREEAGSIYIGNDWLEIGFSKQAGSIVSVLHRGSGVDLISADAGELWTIQLFSESKERFGTNSLMSDSFSYSTSSTVVGSQLEFEWSNTRFEGGDYCLEVEAKVIVFNDSPNSRWKINVTNQGGAAIETIEFPHIWGVKKLGHSGNDDVFVWPGMDGRVVHNPSENPENWYGGSPYPSHEMGMQFVTYYDLDCGFYFATYDRSGYVKAISWGGTRICFSHWSPIVFGSDFVVPYDVVIGVFEGDWHTAVEIYREWACNQWWYLKKPFIPQWMREVQLGNNIDFFAWMNGDYDRLLKSVKYIGDYFDSSVLVVLPWTTDLAEGGEGGMPDYPFAGPIGGWQQFDRFLVELHRLGHYAQIGLPNPLDLSVDSLMWQSGEALAAATKYENGSVVYVGDAHERGAHMCIFTDYWRQRLEEIVLTLIRHGVDVVMFDGLPENDLYDYLCYDPTHGHPIGIGGNWSVNTWIHFLSNLTESVREINPEACLMGIGVAEVYLPLLPICWVGAGGWFIADWERHNDISPMIANEEVIDLFQCVYRGALTIGAHTGGYAHTPYVSYGDFVLSRFLTWGMMPFKFMALAKAEPEFDSPEEQGWFQILKNVVQARRTYAYEYISIGERVYMPEITSPKILVEIPERGYQFYRSSLQHSVYKSLGGDIGFVFTNIRDETLNFDLDVDLSLFGMPEQNFAYFVRDGSYQTIGTVSNLFNSTFEVAPREILLVVFTQGPVGQPDLWVSYCDLPYFDSELYDNRSMINVTLWNTGPVDSGVFNVSVLAHWKSGNLTEVLSTETVDSLHTGENLTLQIPFASENVGDFDLTVEVDPDDSIAEMNEINNEVSVTVEAGVWGEGDLNGDGLVNINDLFIVAKAFGSSMGDPKWNPDADVDGNAEINISDLFKVAKQFGKEWK